MCTRELNVHKLISSLKEAYTFILI
ncbi:hypothetical protein OIU78_007837 [Salix suchowensis]|nr:hypothetical protein OIU78_007837 [Salix suchowensis]